MFNLFDYVNFTDFFIVLLLGIIVLLTLKCKKCHEKFNPEDMYVHSNKGMESCTFSLDCCPSKYTNDKGCMCMDVVEEEFEEEEFEEENVEKEILMTRGANNISEYL